MKAFGKGDGVVKDNGCYEDKIFFIFTMAKKSVILHALDDNVIEDIGGAR